MVKITQMMDPGSPECSELLVDIVPKFALVSSDHEREYLLTKDQV